jgi:hypothetical protein
VPEPGHLGKPYTVPGCILGGVKDTTYTLNPVFLLLKSACMLETNSTPSILGFSLGLNPVLVLVYTIAENFPLAKAAKAGSSKGGCIGSLLNIAQIFPEFNGNLPP